MSNKAASAAAQDEQLYVVMVDGKRATSAVTKSVAESKRGAVLESAGSGVKPSVTIVPYLKG